MGNLKQTFNNLVSTMNYYDLYKKDDEVGIGLEELSNLIDEVEKRMECAIRSNKDNEVLVLKLANSFQDEGKLQEIIDYGDFETMQRSVYDVDIALDLKDTECIDNDWYGLFEEPKENVSSETLEEPPTYQCQNVQTFDKVKNIIQLLKTLDNGDCVDGETMQYILEQVGMNDQMLRQLIMSNPESDTKDLLEEKQILNEARLEASKIN